MAQADISLTYDGFLEKWTAFMRFDFSVSNEERSAIECVLCEGPTFQEALDNLKNLPVVQRYFELLKDSADGAEQNARIN
jgi:hypothetical protein